MKLTALFVLLVALLSACAAPVTQQPESVSARDSFARGLAAFEQWDNEQQFQYLYRAESDLNKVSKEYSDNAQWQTYYFRTLYTLSALDWHFWHIRLEQHYSRLNKLVKSDLLPPAFLEYRLLEEGSDVQRKQQLLFRALQQHPRSHPVWYHLSLLYQQQSQLELALYAARTAEKYSVDVANVNFQVGSLYRELAATKSCSYEYPQLERQAVKYLARSTGLKPESAIFQESLANVYNHIGLFPLALQVAQKAYDLEKNDLTLSGLADAHFGMGQYAAAKRLYEQLLADYQGEWAHESLLATAIVDSRWADAVVHAESMLAAYPDNVYFYAMKRWVRNLSNTSGSDSTPAVQEPWSGLVLDYVADVDTHDFDSLINAADNVCQSTEAHFYTAMRLWFGGDPVGAKAHLEAVLALNNYSYLEYRWAKAMLLSDMFSG